MNFTEKTKLLVKQKSNFRCCICNTIGVEIHHIIPKSEQGNNQIDNAAPLCPTCHELYGDNPKKRKFIREIRDFWYRKCANTTDPNLYFEITRKVRLLEKKLGIEELLSETGTSNKYLSIGEVIDFYCSEVVVDDQGFEISKLLILKTKGDPKNDIDSEFNSFRDFFLSEFGEYLTTKIILFCHNRASINWIKGANELDLVKFLSFCHTSMLLLYMHSDLPYYPKAKCTFNSDKTDLIYSVL